ncbi:MAG: glycosyltransferase family 4 protein [Methanocella sp.]
MRIAFFAWEYPPRLVGGLGTYAEYITRDLVRMGADVVVLTENTGTLKTSEVVHGVEVHRPLNVDASGIMRIIADGELQSWGDQLRFFSAIFTNDVLCTAKFVNSLIRMEHVQFDMVCVHDWMGGMAASIIKAETDLPVVFHVHSTEWGRSRGEGSKVVNDIEYHTSAIADRIITVSYSMKEDLVRHGWPGEKIFVVWNGVDPEVYSPESVRPQEIEALRAKYGIADDEKMLLFVGRLNWVKGIVDLVQAMPSILKEFPKTKLVILGTGDEEANIRNMLGRLGIRDHVICRFEFVSEHERIVHYAAADLCAFPSLYEPFGIVSLEAMAMEKPIVVGARGVSGLKEQVVSAGHGQTGIHVDGGSPADIAWGVKEILSHPEKAKQWGLNARERVLQYFTWDKASRQTLDVYEGLVKSRSGSGTHER